MQYFNRITMHHTGGAYQANSVDLRSYHTVTQGDGTTVKGNNPYMANAMGKKLVNGKYAAHTLNLNTGNIGKAVACMSGGQWGDPYACKFFPRASQMDAFLIDVAKDAKYYGIPITRENVLTHAEVEITLGVKQKQKWDFDYDPYRIITKRDPIAIGDYLREKIRRYQIELDDIRTTPDPVEPTNWRLLLKQGDQGPFVAELQSMLNVHGWHITIDGKFGPNTRQAVLAFQKSRQLVQDGIVGRATWAALEAV